MQCVRYKYKRYFIIKKFKLVIKMLIRLIIATKVMTVYGTVEYTNNK